MPHPRPPCLALAFSLSLLASFPARAAHPDTVFDSATLEQLQSERTTTHSEIASALEGEMKPQIGHVLSPSDFDDPRLLGNVVAGDAIAAVILDDSTMRALAISNLEQELGWTDWGFGEGMPDLNRAHLLIGAAIAYDVLYPVLSLSDRQAAHDRIGSEAQAFADAVQNGVWWSTDWLQNHNWVDFGALGLAGFALQGEDSRAAGWIALARGDSALVKQVTDLVTDGSWHEGVGYQQYGWSFAMPYWLASGRTGVDVSQSAMLNAYGAYRLWTQLPDQPNGYITTTGDWSGWSGAGSLQVLRYAAAHYQDGYAQAAADRWLAGTPRSTHPDDTYYTALEYLVYDPSVKPVDVSTLSTDFYGEDQQLAVLRSGFQPGSLVVGFKSGMLGGKANWTRLKNGGAPGGSLNIGHDHMDDLGLWIYGHGQWLLPECVGYNIGTSSAPKAFQTQFHNALLFDGTGEWGDDKVGDDGPAYPWFFQRYGAMKTVASTAHYAFAVGEGTHLYPAADQVSSLTRTVALDRDGYAVLSDDVRLGGAHAVDQVFHFLDAASQQGSWIEGAAHADQVLGVQVVSPSSFTASVSTQTADKLTKQFEPDGEVSLVEVQPSSPVSAARFLDLLYPTTGTAWSSRPTAQPLDAAHPERGFSLAFQGGTDLWLFAPDGAIAAGAYSLTAPAAVLRASSSGAYARLALVGPGELRDGGGEHLLLSSSAPGALEADISGTNVALTGKDASSAEISAPDATSVAFDGAPIVWHREGDLVVIGAAPSPGPDGGTNDAGATDAGSADAGSTDAGSTDAGCIDPGTLDAGSVDSGSPAGGGASASGGGGATVTAAYVPGAGRGRLPESGRAGLPLCASKKGSASASWVERATAGCGCSGEGGSALALFVLLALARRRRFSSPG